jgi:hypothetical protein
MEAIFILQNFCERDEDGFIYKEDRLNCMLSYD